VVLQHKVRKRYKGNSVDYRMDLQLYTVVSTTGTSLKALFGPETEDTDSQQEQLQRAVHEPVCLVPGLCGQVPVVKGYGRCCHRNYRAHMRIPDATHMP